MSGGRRLRRLALATLAGAAGLAGPGAALAEGEGPASAPATAPAATAGSPPAAAPAGPAPTTAPPSSAEGIVVVALGEGAEGPARSLAREVYAAPGLRPSLDEARAQVLCGAPPPADPALAELAALRAALDPDPAHPAGRRALESLARELGARGVLAVFRDASGAPRAALLVPGRAGPEVLLIGREGPEGASWPGAAPSLAALLGEPAAPPRPAAAAPRAAPAAPRPTPATAPAPPPEEDDAFYERPWFWVALGAFAAAGVTALVVSQTSGDAEPSDTARFRATIPQAALALPWSP